MRLGYFGGSFDPPHRAHLLVAELARRQLTLDRVLLAPTGRQPLKSRGTEAPFADRLRMVELLCDGHPGLEASAIDGPRPAGEPNYTVDTLRRLRASFADSLAQAPFPDTPAPHPNAGFVPVPRAPMEIFAIIGADAFLGIRQWRHPDELFRLAQWIVISRPGFVPDVESLRLDPAQTAAVHLLPGLHDPLSATELRRRLRAGMDCHALMPSGVLQYVEDRKLYRG